MDLPVGHPATLTRAVWRTWRAPGLARRARYEAARRSGRLRAAEQRWQATMVPTGAVLRPAGIEVPVGLGSAAIGKDEVPKCGPEEILIYGAVPVPVPHAEGWHRHPLTGHGFDAAAHWSALSDASPSAGDIKDVWEPSRLGWLLRRLREWAIGDDEAIAEEIWSVVEDWQASNPAYLGPNWMCGQETSLRTITVMFLADALAASPATTDERRHLVAAMVHDAVGRVAPTLGYALSQRNNHAISEAGFLWTASVLSPWLPGAASIRRRASQALTEAVTDQVDVDGSYSQHSPTYQRVALHVLLWCMAVARSTGEPTPDGVAEAVARSVTHLRAILVPGSQGLVPNLGGNDGALVFDLGAGDITDLRPVVAHAAVASGQDHGLGAGRWDQEAAWFGLASSSTAERRAVVRRPAVRSRSTHALTHSGAHAVLRAGPLSHRPAHADQLHLDIWLAGSPVAVDAGSYRYTAPAPWGNALADEAVHNLARVPGQPQAVRTGRFFWSSWQEAEIVDRHHDDSSSTLVARLALPGGIAVCRTVNVHDGLVAVVDHTAGAATEVRWNLAPEVTVTTEIGVSTAIGSGWRAGFAHHGGATVAQRDPADPTSGWHAPHYGIREPVTAVVYDTMPGSNAVAVFAIDHRRDGQVIDVISALARTRPDRAATVAATVASAVG